MYIFHVCKYNNHNTLTILYAFYLIIFDTIQLLVVTNKVISNPDSKSQPGFKWSGKKEKLNYKSF